MNHKQKEKFGQKYGSHAIVTGASAGIGKEFALALAKIGVAPILVARRKDLLQKLRLQIKENYNIDSPVIATDISRFDNIESLYKKTKNYDVGLLVLNAGFGLLGEFSQQPIDKLKNMVDINCWSPLHLAHLFFEQLQKRKSSGVIFLSSVVAHHCSPYMSVYSATKAFDRSLAHGLYHEWKKFSIDVLTVSPGPVKTEFAQIAQMNNAKEIHPRKVANHALQSLGKRVEVIPGFSGKLMTLGRNILPTRQALAITATIMQKMRTLKK